MQGRRRRGALAELKKDPRAQEPQKASGGDQGERRMKIYKIVVGFLETNCYIVASGKGRAFVIDPGDDLERIKGVLTTHKLKPEFIVNTHGHIDHIKANADFQLPVFVHEYDRDMIADVGKNASTVILGTFKPVVPGRILKDGDLLTLDELQFKVVHTPGHTRGCICLLGEGVLFSGDTLFRGGIGRTDFPGASDKEMQRSLMKLAQLPADTVVYPGHGEKTTIGRELTSEIG